MLPRNWTSRVTKVLKRISLVAWLSVAATGVAAVATVLTSLSEIRDFFGWKRQAEYMEHVNSLIEELEKSSAESPALVPRAKWTISRLAAIGETEEEQRAGLTGLIADYIRVRAGYERGSEQAMALRKGRCLDDVEYAVQVLGSCPLRGSWIGGPVKYLEVRVVGIPQAYLQKRYYHQVDFADAIIFKSNLIEAQFIECNLSGADLDSTRAVHACFDRSSLNKAQLVGAELAGATFRKTSLEGTDFTGACLKGCDFSDAKGYKSAKWSGAHIIDIRGQPELVDWLNKQPGIVKFCPVESPRSHPSPVGPKCTRGLSRD